MPRQLTLEELQAGLPRILASPSDEGVLRCIVIRPAKAERTELESCGVSLAAGVQGDRWAKGCWMKTEAGRPHPDVQICIMNARCIDLIAQERSNWSPAGDNLFVDMDLARANLPAGSRLAIGSAVIEITDIPHDGCGVFARRYGRDARQFVNSAVGKQNRLRGVYARVVQDGEIAVGYRVIKLS
jgi:MOSC domain-containing protein YiiM